MFEPETPPAPQNQPPTPYTDQLVQPERWRRPRALIVLYISLPVIIIGVTLFIITNRTTTNSCLTASDYTALTGFSPDADSIAPKQNFYTDYVSFKPNTLAYNDTTDAPHGSRLLAKISSFYATHSAASLRISISGQYYVDTNEHSLLAQRRIDTVKASLINQGVPARLITADAPNYIEPEDESPDESNATAVTITSTEDCN